MDSDKSICVTTDTKTGIRKITFDKPNRRNAISLMMYKQIPEILKEAANDESVRMVVITGNGQFFTSGNDMGRLMESGQDFSFQSLDNAMIVIKMFIDSLITFPKLLIAIVNGPAIGIGVTMLGLCDMVYASEKATFQTPFSALGLNAECCSAYTFPRIMGTSKAGDMLYFGYKMNATEAKEYGLVSAVYPDDAISDLWTYLNKISSLSMESIMATKRLLRQCNEKMLLEINAAEVEEVKQRWRNPEVFERVMAVLSRKSKL